ncbi:hypothetical protein [Chitinilyticum piscinae]|uniref:Transmembrane protein n=1 Tax=Chitinilyticum piscinae TaxID=2866724 RepID=A0A8J7KAQ0_9NEIS|nr:hypothetical protein [Chitinilyticum piscinae]MBE9609334.1 hypothetical protein [Chitinilyticum piscinae]
MPRPTLDLYDESASALFDAIRLDGWWALGTLLVSGAFYIAAPAMAQMAHQSSAANRQFALLLGGHALLRFVLAQLAQQRERWLWASALASLPAWVVLLMVIVLTAGTPMLLAGAICLVLILYASSLRIIPRLLVILRWPAPMGR